MSLKLVGPHWFDLSRTALYSPVVMVQVDEDPGHHTSDFYEKKSPGNSPFVRPYKDYEEKHQANFFSLLSSSNLLFYIMQCSFTSRVIFMKINLNVDFVMLFVRPYKITQFRYFFFYFC